MYSRFLLTKDYGLQCFQISAMCWMCWRFGFDFSLPAVYLGGCPHNAIRGADQFSDKEALRLMNPGNVKTVFWDTDGCNLFMHLVW